MQRLRCSEAQSEAQKLKGSQAHRRRGSEAQRLSQRLSQKLRYAQKLRGRAKGSGAERLSAGLVRGSVLA